MGDYQPADDEKVLFSKREYFNVELGHQICELRLLDPLTGVTNKDINERNELSTYIPHPLRLNRLLSEEEMAAIDYTSMKDDLPFYIRPKHHTEPGNVKNATTVVTQKNLVPYARYYSAIATEKLGFHPIMAAFREKLTRPGTEKRFHSAVGARTVEAHGNVYDLGFTVQQEARNIQTSKVARLGDPEVRYLITDIIRIAMVLLEKAFPGRDSDIQTRSWLGNASIGIGHRDNTEFTSIQVNISELKSDLNSSLKDFGSLHMDATENPISFTASFCVSHLPENYFPGRFAITPARLMCLTAPFTALVFTANQPHIALAGGRYPKGLPHDSPLRYSPKVDLPELPHDNCNKPFGVRDYRRINVIPYPNIKMQEYETHKLRDTVFDDDSLLVWGSMRNKREFEMRHAIRRLVERLLEIMEKEDTGLNQLKEDVESYSCGNKFRGYKTCKYVTWTHERQLIRFRDSISGGSRKDS
ncbi:hypothetical protein HYALB_00003931 [Hymenoscyphus albidus]|uniref:Uncharacterized protein n=1 Tax=Hymenoscyphus albidus TaxID=595503 RepID=A0A9N9LQY3_9HELO|nr:hypothetical protein HYALB_00003931 [Hymenoscyphus albidus]